jgi:formylglycine-generating enzyme required for sulfatase activity
MGWTYEEVCACVDYWGPRLVDASYDMVRFRQWVLKEYPKHPVRVAAYRIGRFPVTNREYLAFMGAPRGVRVPGSTAAPRTRPRGYRR